jgi:hypothetical protein
MTNIIKMNFLQQINSYPKVFNFIHNLWVNNFKNFGFEYLVEKIFEEIKTVDNFDNLIIRIDEILRDKEFKKFNRKSFSQSKFKAFQFEIVKPFLDKAESILDFGCGKMALIRRISKEDDFEKIKILAGYDPNLEINYKDFDSRAVFYNRKSDLIGKKFDLIISSFVLHHMTKDEIEENLNLINSILTENGKFILIEESFDGKFPNFDSIEFLKNTDFEISSELTQEFLDLTLEQKFLAIYLNDILINYRNLDYIPWTNQYKTMIEWRSLCEKYGFKFEKEYFFGIINKGRLKQGITSTQTFSKATTKPT